MAKKKAASKADKTPTFETSLADLEQIVSELESGELGLEQSLDAYEKGIQRLKECHQHLKAAERRVEQLSGFDAEGNPILEPLDDTPTASQRGSKPASNPRARRKTDLDDDDPALF
ncbi:exodeoxyribonuclease VII small subunit [Roseimaritima ulvae]|uniref:exodeoxyribonuclease VII small subunit n=1 Tax=Roseimaritima ulvae TaxID=980254 RepID=UPI000A065B89|nr:exodeoxyribonuclease VII small subunit [Roseimaritima ulvae]